MFSSPISRSSTSRSAGLWFALAVIVATIVAALIPIHLRIDDSYITLHNARSLLEGADPRFGQNPLVGATSPVHLLLVTLAGLFLPWPNAGLVVSVLGTAAYAAGLWRWGWRVTIIGLLAGTVSLQLFNGLETSLAMAAITWALVWMDDRRLPVLAGLMPFIRPELALLAALLMARDLWLRRDWRRPAIAALVALPFFLWLWAATGSVLPNTIGAKAAWFRDDYGWGERLGRVGTSILLSFMVPPMIGLVPLWKRPAGRLLLLFLALWIGTVTVTYPNAMWSNDGRYWANAVPILCYGLGPLTQRAVLGGVLLTFGLLQLHPVPHGNPWAPMIEAARRLPAGSTVLIHDAGEIAYANPPLKLVDVVGLKTPRSAEIVRAHHSRACRWGPALDQIARESGARYLIAMDHDLWACIPRNLAEEGWTVSPIHADPGAFTIYAIAPPSARR